MPPDGAVRGTAVAARLRFLVDAAPLIVSRAGLAAMGIVNMVMLARYASGELAVAALAEGTFGRLLDICVAFLAGALPLLGLAHGAGDHGRTLAIWRRSCCVALLLALPCVAIGAAAEGLYTLAGQPLAAAAARVVGIHAAGAAFALIAIASAIFLEGVRRARDVAAAIIVANLANLALNPVLIAGGWGLPALGAQGSALATLVVRIGLCAALVALVAAEARRRALPLVAAPRIMRDGGTEQWRIGATIGATAAAMHGFGVMLMVMAGWSGALPLAAYASLWVINLPFMLFAAGYGDATTLRVAGGEPGAARRDAVALALLLAVPALIVGLGAGGIAHLYSGDPELRALLAVLLPVSACVLWLDGIGAFLVAALRGLRDVAVPGMIQIGTMALTPPLAALLGLVLGLGVVGMVLAILATSLLRTALLFARAVPLLRTRRAPAAIGIQGSLL